MTYKFDNKIIEKVLDFNNNNMIKLNNGNTLSKIIIGNYLKKNIINEKEEIKLSKKYNVLSKNTSLFAEIKREKFLFFKTTQQIKSIKFNKKKEDSESEGFVFKTKQKISNIFNNIFTNKKQSLMKDAIEAEYTTAMRPDFCDRKFLFDDIEFNKVSSKNENNDIKNNSNEKKEEKKENQIKEEKFDIKNIILSQNIMEGYWEKNKETEKIINKINDIYEKINNYLNEKKIEDNLEKILFTFIMIYYIENKEQNLINDFFLYWKKERNI